jgi:hypothetical protein
MVIRARVKSLIPDTTIFLSESRFMYKPYINQENVFSTIQFFGENTYERIV